MADVAVTPKGYTENPDLMPTPRSQQKYGFIREFRGTPHGS
jgi:hypothetical protein